MESFGVKTSNQRERIQNCRKHIGSSEFFTIIHASATHRGWFASPGLDERDSSSQTASTDAAPACVHAVGVVTMARWRKRRRPKLFSRPTRAAERKSGARVVLAREST